MSLLPLTVLRRARKLIAEPGTWIRGAFTAKRRGVQCYCALGALAATAGVRILNKDSLSDDAPTEYHEAHDLLSDAIRKVSGSGWVPGFNDDAHTTQAAVLAVFDKAIEAAKKQRDAQLAA